MKNIYDNPVEYRKAMLNDQITPREIMENITLPQYVYKYRKYDTRYLKESLDGKMYFSSPADMNYNDPDDCKIKFDDEEVLRSILHGKISEENQSSHDKLKEYQKSLQKQLRIGCFTTCDCSRMEMWDNPDFGDKNRGYCIKYKVEPKYFYPDKLIFLKMIYDDNGFDATDLMKNLNEIRESEEKGHPYCQEKYIMKMVCLAHNHTLFKPVKYMNEEEWRIIIPINRVQTYFEKKDSCTKDFSSLMQSVCLGSEFHKSDVNGEMYDYALSVCKKYKIPLYIMRKNGGKLEEKIEYSPE